MSTMNHMEEPLSTTVFSATAHMPTDFTLPGTDFALAGTYVDRFTQVNML